MRFLWTFTLWLVLLALPFATLAAVDASMGPSHHAEAEHCTRACHDGGCRHLGQKVDRDRPVVRAAEAVYAANIQALKQPSYGYRDTNLLVYVLGFPSVAAVLLWGVLWRRPTRWGWLALVASGGLLGGLVAVTVVRAEGLLAWGTGRDALYWACTDFCVHMGNLTGWTYEGFNFVLFVVGFPATIVGLGLACVGRLIARGSRGRGAEGEAG